MANQQIGQGDAGRVNDPEAGVGPKGFELADDSVRRGFVRKVYTILMVQLLFTCGVASLLLFHEPTQLWFREHEWMVYVAAGIVLVATIALACCGNLRRKPPINYILLAVITIGYAFMLGIAAAAFKLEEVLMALGMTIAVCIGLTIFAWIACCDFTMWGGFLLVALIVLTIMGILMIFIRNRILGIVYSALATILFSFYLVYHTQQIIGGKHRNQLSPDEYVFAALLLYQDIINIFLHILELIRLMRH